MPNINTQSLNSKKVMANVQKKGKGHGQGHTLKTYGTIGNTL